MEIVRLTATDKMWSCVREYARNCSWRAGKSLAEKMENNSFLEWERVIVAIEDDKICGYCIVVQTDCIPNLSYTPYIGYVFVEEEYRGNRLSQRLIEYAMEYLKTLGFPNVYIMSDHENLYEKYGFEVIDRRMAPWGKEQKVYIQQLK